MILVVGLSVYVTQRTLTSMEALAEKSVDDASNLVVQHVENFFSVIEVYDDILTPSFQGDAPFMDRAILNEQSSRRFIRNFPYLLSLQYGDQLGNFVMYRKDELGNINTKVVLTDEALPDEQRNPRTIWRYFDGDKLIKQVEIDGIDYDPRTRPWYVGARSAQDLYMTEPYEFFTGRKLGITAGKRLNREGTTEGVYSFDLSLDEIIKYISTINTTRSAETYIVTAQKKVLGLVTEPLTQRQYSSFVSALNPSEMTLINEGDLGRVQKIQYDKLTEPYYIIFDKILKQYTNPWHIAIRIKKNTLLSAYRSNVFLNGALSLFLILLTAMLLYYRYRQHLIHEKLEYIARRDQLTGLLNRYSFEEISNMLMQRHETKGELFSVVLGDIDMFKQINDNHGHHTGDMVLVSLSRIIDENVRASDYACRWGGEEFLIIMANTDLEKAVKMASSLLTRISEQSINTPAGVMQVTMSFGVATYDGKETMLNLINRADKLLFKAKEQGRNQICY